MLKRAVQDGYDVWIRVIADPHAAGRGFSIQGREMRVIGYEPVSDVQYTLDGKQQPGLFWAVEANEFYRSIPEMKRILVQDRAWFMPVEFCEPLFRPKNYLQMKIIDVNLMPGAP